MVEGEVLLAEALSEARFRPYLTECGGDRAQALRLYAWNGEAGRAFHGIIGDLEIVLRNRLHVRLVERYGREDWWSAQHVRLSTTSNRQIRKAQETLRRRLAGCYGADDMVAELTFGFWTGLLGTAANYRFQFWQPALRHCFQGYHGPQGRLKEQFESVRYLRNRIAHYERIYHRDLQADYLTCLRLLRYLSPEAALRHEKWSQVPEALARRESVLSGSEEVRL